MSVRNADQLRRGRFGAGCAGAGCCRSSRASRRPGSAGGSPRCRSVSSAALVVRPAAVAARDSGIPPSQRSRRMRAVGPSGRTGGSAGPRNSSARRASTVNSPYEWQRNCAPRARRRATAGWERSSSLCVPLRRHADVLRGGVVGIGAAEHDGGHGRLSPGPGVARIEVVLGDLDVGVVEPGGQVAAVLPRRVSGLGVVGGTERPRRNVSANASFRRCGGRSARRPSGRVRSGPASCLRVGRGGSGPTSGDRRHQAGPGSPGRRRPGGRRRERATRRRGRLTARC